MSEELKPIGSVMESSVGIDLEHPKTQVDEIITKVVKERRPIIATVERGKLKEVAIIRKKRP